MLPENFRHPYHAKTPAEFWNGWHMTLSRWIRDYLFFPINAKWTNRPWVLYSSMIGIMALVGLWHGAGWGFIVWGILHGVYLVLFRMYEGVKNVRPALADSRSAAIGGRALTLIAVVVAWVPFRATSLAKAGAMLDAMFWRFRSGREFTEVFYLLTVFVVLFCALEPLLMRALADWDEREEAEGISPMRVLVRPILYALGLLVFLLLDTNNAQFIYSQF
jgi:D-alanyl-lipoteichoic acid acyltransferase DltB (MBOAT superfamily)